MLLSKLAKSQNSLKSLSLMFVFFLGATLLDFKLPSLDIYPIYLISILYASINFSFISSLPLSAIASYLSIHDKAAAFGGDLNIIIVRFILLSVISYLFSVYIGLVKTYRLRFALLKSILPQCPDCGAILCQDGRWRSLEDISESPDLIGTLPKHDCKIESKSPFIDLS
jgi:predicted tellurium resistance membrane protein TerC